MSLFEGYYSCPAKSPRLPDKRKDVKEIAPGTLGFVIYISQATARAFKAAASVPGLWPAC
jgi:hypothetical protein